MAIKVQCEKCGSVMNIRETYAGTERTCPKCHHKFRVPDLPAGTDAPPSEATPEAATETTAPSPAEDDFDAVAFLTGEKPAKGAAPAPKGAKPAKEKPAGKAKGTDAPVKKAAEKKLADDFDPLDVLSEGKPKPAPQKPAPSASDILKKGSPASPAAASQPASTPATSEEEFDPLAVLGTGPTPAAPPTAAAPTPATPEKPAEPEPYKPRRPSWAKPLPDDKAEPAAAATPAAEPEKPAEAEPYKPRRPSWAKPLPGEEPAKPAPGAAAPSAAAALTTAPADASPAALAAAAAMGGQVQAKLPPEEKVEPKGPWFDKAAFVARIKRNLRLIAITVPTALVLFGISWRFVRPWYVPIPALAPVSGVVTLDGQPLAGALVQYHPRSNQFRSPMAVTDGEGRYQLEYWKGQGGAPAARYRVQVQQLDKQGRDTIPPRFGQATLQEVTVRTDGQSSSSFDIAIVTK